jgi:uncharacterized membrane protein YccF (DUF307 family)
MVDEALVLALDLKLVPISLMPLGKDIVSTRRGAFDSTLSRS